MKWSVLLLLFPASVFAQFNSAWVVKDNLVFGKLENSGNGMFGFERSGKYGYIDKTGKEVIAPELEYDGTTTSKIIPSFNAGYAIIKKDKKAGLIDKTGKTIIPAEYYSLTYIQQTGVVTAAKSENYKTTYGLLSLQNKVIMPFEYESLYVDSNMVTVKKGSKYGLFDITGKQLFPIEYTNIISLPKEKAAILSKDGNFSLTELTGKVLFEKPASVYTMYGAANGFIKCVVNGKYGYLDLKGNEVVTTKYDYAGNFESVGLAQVGKKSSSNSYSYTYGYVDKKGVEVIPLNYGGLGSFQQGLLVVKDPETNRYGFMDKTGKWAIAANFIDAASFSTEGTAQVKMLDGKYHFINTTGKDLGILNEKATAITSFTDGYSVQQLTDQPYVIIDKNGKILKTLSDCSGIYNFSEGIAGIKSASTSLYGFIDIQGNIVIPPAYTSFTGFEEGVSKVSKLVEGKTKYGYINTKGEIVLPIIYDEAFAFRNGWGLVKKDGLYFFADKKGELKEPPRKYDQLTEFKSGMALGKINGVTNGPNTYYYINTSLKEEFNLQAPYSSPFWNDIAIVRRDKDLELMNKKGEVYKALTGVQLLAFATENTMAAKQNGKWGFIDFQGKEIVAPIYDSCEAFKNGFARVRSGTKWGMIDKTGAEVIPPKYTSIYQGDNGIFVYLDAWWGVIDKTGKILVQPTYYTTTIFEKDKALAKSGPQYMIIKSPKGL